VACHVERAGVRIYYEASGHGDPAVLLLPTWEIVDSRCWKFQVPYLSRHGRVVSFDRRGSGRSDRPSAVSAYDRRETAADALAVLDDAGVERAVAVSWCGGGDDLILAAEHPGRIAGLILIAPDLLLTEDPADGWELWDPGYWVRDWPGFVSFFFGQAFSEPHSTKQLEDAIGWALEADPEVIARGIGAEWPNDPGSAARLCAAVRCPALVIQGTDDAVVGPARGPAVAAAIPGAALVTLEGCGHAPHLRHPVVVNRLIREFASRV
jgi:pimeloyl-ACP methyl ester carboxylesterase